MHRRSIYRWKWQGHDVLICRQVDDFLFAAKDRSICTSLAEALRDGDENTGRDSIRLAINDEPVTACNSINIEQTHDYIKINCKDYIEKILAGHGWSQAPEKETFEESLHLSAIISIESARGPNDVREAATLAEKMKFSYRAPIGELIYASVTCRPDIRCAVAELAKFSNNPAEEHYQADESSSISGRPRTTVSSSGESIHVKIFHPSQFQPRTIDEDNALVPHPVRPDQLGAYFNAAHATCSSTRRSTGAFYHYSRRIRHMLQGKMAPDGRHKLYRGRIHGSRQLRQGCLGVKQDGPTIIYGDNVACWHLATSTSKRVLVLSVRDL